MIQKLNTKPVTAAKGNAMTPTQVKEVKKLLSDYMDSKGITGDIYVGKQKIMVILPD